MSLASPNTGGSAPQEPIPGYRLLERLGRGGYGEVWKTIAPGGVPKALKLIYGDDPARLATEQRALNRIKDVRHPFLLSIERIEQQGEFLAIVTELADGNLQQYFNECRSRDLPGVPQNELLTMMRDVADVLDYIYQEYALQHLDVKPANLLMFGRRLKVGDYGLVKNIYERSDSLVHGLTPTYAAPEIFNGQPSRSSDQYSLAVLYQEMLTGCLPFNGTTAARLATQHLRECPDLSPLPPAQRPVIARALSKDPQHRFATMSEMVEELGAAVKEASRAPQSTESTAASVPQQQRIETGGPAKNPTTTVASAALGDTLQRTAATASKKVDGPFIVIGMGGSAGKILQRLRIRIADRNPAEKPDLPRLIFFDLDNESLNELNREMPHLCDVHALPTLLQSSSAYREQGNLHRRWLSRRWLFNVPRSLRTEGLRPLGRLALLSNANRSLESIRAAIQSAVSSSGGKAPGVLLVSSISGGTGSGMLIDVAYTVRHELARIGHRDATVDGILVHSSPVGPGRDMAKLNAVATLREISHFSTDGAFYPGESILGVPPFHGNNQTFRSTQLVCLGDELSSADWLRGLDNVAELLYCRLFSDLDTVRTRTGAASAPAIDLAQVQQIGGYAGTFVDEQTRQICADMIDQWCEAPAPREQEPVGALATASMIQQTIQQIQTPKTHAIISEAEKRLQSSGVDVEQLVAQARECLEQELGMSKTDFLQSQFNEALAAVKPEAPDHELATLVIALQDRAIGLDFGERPNDCARNTLFDRLYPRLTSQGMPIAARFLSWVCEVIDSPTGSVDSAREAAEAGRNCIRDLIAVIGQSILDWQTQQTNSRISLTAAPSEGQQQKGRSWLFRKQDTRGPLAEKLLEHGGSSLQELLLLLTQWQLRSIEANISAVIDELLGMWHELKQLGKRLGADGSVPASGLGQTSRFEDALQTRLIEMRPRLIAELRKRIENQTLSGTRKLQRLLHCRGTYDKLLAGPIQRLARQVVLDSINRLLGAALQQRQVEGASPMPGLGPAIKSALDHPSMVHNAARPQTLLIAPAETRCTQFKDNSALGGESIRVLPAKTNNVAVFSEHAGVPVAGVINSLCGGSRNLLAIAANLHSRIDIQWAESEASGPTPMELNSTMEVSSTMQLGS